MKYSAFLIVLLINVLASPAQSHVSDENTKDKQTRAAVADEPDHVEGLGEAAIINADMAKRVGIEVSSAGPGTIERHLPLYGELVIPPNRQAQVRARFPGVIAQIKASVGDKVSKADVLALVESNDSLRTYPLTAPISGVVIQQYASQGEYTAGESLFSLADSSVLWVELKMFPASLDEIKTGLPVHIEARGGRVDSHISHILPVTGQPYVLARVVLDNSQNRFAAGERVRALVDAEIINVSLVVDNRALQQLDGKQVVFVREGTRYEPRPVQLGRTDGRFSEVLSGLHAAEDYVVVNSYLIKAEIEKAGAAHEH
ncbi:hypothetical protein GCM10009098_05360 [Rheinheimera aquimaris]|uniref:RND family efflux transporter, MFP subunit n=1 Tax=Rheinheimera aquimaris TaxID=412437 RepID=A0ABN1DDQ6_9GAMM|nr:efflux RND transporter periplasmic adaptor subunit [Rheinheimera aquimaris]MCB5212288.1 efflux RND transporter periplasmic adaptor subunit [Rheinheimera aquimaris]